MQAEGTESRGPSESLGAPDHDRSGSTVEEAVAKSEKGSQVEGVHTVPGEVHPGESRGERMREVEGMVDGDVDEHDPVATSSASEPGPAPTESGSGGAQRVVGARMSDRASAGDEPPDAPPLDTGADGRPGVEG